MVTLVLCVPRHCTTLHCYLVFLTVSSCTRSGMGACKWGLRQLQNNVHASDKACSSHERVYLVPLNAIKDLQLLIQILSIGPHKLAELKAPLNVSRIYEVVHVQDLHSLIGASSGRCRCVAASSQRRHVTLDQLNKESQMSALCSGVFICSAPYGDVYVGFHRLDMHEDTTVSQKSNLQHCRMILTRKGDDCFRQSCGDLSP